MIEEARQTILEGLRKHRGSQAEVVRKTRTLKHGGYTRDHVFKVLTGERRNVAILNVAADVLADCIKKKNTQINSLNQKVAEFSAA